MASEIAGAPRERNTVVDPTFDQRKRRAPHRHVPRVGRQARPCRERGVGVELVSHGLTIAEFEQVDQAPVAGLERELAVVRALGELQHLIGKFLAPLGVVRAP